MFLLVTFLVLAAVICGPIYFVQSLVREWQQVAAMTREQRAEHQREEWRKAGRTLGGTLFWTWVVVWGAILAGATAAYFSIL